MVAPEPTVSALLRPFWDRAFTALVGTAREQLFGLSRVVLDFVVSLISGELIFRIET